MTSVKSPQFWAHATALFFTFLCALFLFFVRGLFDLPPSPLTMVLAVAVGGMAGLIFFVAVAIELSIAMYPLE